EPWEPTGSPTCLQIVAGDDGVRLVIDGVQRFLLSSCAGPGHLEVGTTEQDANRDLVQCLHVLPRDVLVPEELRVRMPFVAAGREVVLNDTFSDAAGDLDGRDLGGVGLAPAASWRKELGAARIEVAPEGGAKVRGARALTFRGRTIYT